MLLQLPPDMPVEVARLEATLAAFPKAAWVAVEPRHDSWFSAEVRTVLAQHGAALCLADRRRPLTPAWATTSWGYVRFHAGRASPPGCYGEAALRTWADRIAGLWPRGADVFAYFNNDSHGCAIHDAAGLARIARRGRLQPTATPGSAPVRDARATSLRAARAGPSPPS